MKQEHVNEIKAILILALGMLFLASLVSFVPEDLPWYTSNPNVPAKNLVRITGAYLAGSLLFIVGNSSYILVFILLILSWNLTFASNKDFNFTITKFISFVILLFAVSAIFTMIGSQESFLKFQRGGLFGITISDFLVQYLGRTGAYIILTTISILSFIVTCEFLVTPFFLKGIEAFQNIFESIKER